MKSVPKGPTDNNSPLIQEMAWHQTGNNQLHVPKTIKC